MAGRHCCITIFPPRVLSLCGCIQRQLNDYYDIVIDICDIGVETFAPRCQELLVNLRRTYGDDVANWCSEFWTDARARGRMCLARSRYGGCNNSMGVGVSWLKIKKLCDCMASLGQFIGCLCHFIKTALGGKHMQ